MLYVDNYECFDVLILYHVNVIAQNAVDLLIKDIKSGGKAPKTGNIVSTEIIIND